MQEVIGQGFTQPIIPTEVCEQLKDKSTTQEDDTETVTQSINVSICHLILIMCKYNIL